MHAIEEAVVRILLVAEADDCLVRRVAVELHDRGHTVAGAAPGDLEPQAAVARGPAPDAVVALALRTVLPQPWSPGRPCFVVCLAPPGDLGCGTLAGAMAEGRTTWGVTVVEAAPGTHQDKGPAPGATWAWAPCALPGAGWSDVYRGEIADAVVQALVLALARWASGACRPRPGLLPAAHTEPGGGQGLRRIDWGRAPTDAVLRTLRAADGPCGVVDDLLGDGAQWYLHGGHFEDQLRGSPGAIVATRAGAVCRATVDGAVWIPRVSSPRTATAHGAAGGGAVRGRRLPATVALGEGLPSAPEVPAPLWLPERRRTYSEIRYVEQDGAGFVWFAFPDGAVGTVQCRRLLAAWRFACTRPTRVVVLGTARGVFCNGVHLGAVEIATDPAGEARANAAALADVVEAVRATTDKWVVTAVGGDAAADGVLLARAGDEMWCRSGVVLRPQGAVPGVSEPGASLPGASGPVPGSGAGTSVPAPSSPVSAAGARRLGLADHVVLCSPEAFAEQVTARAVALAGDAATAGRTREKQTSRRDAVGTTGAAAHRETAPPAAEPAETAPR